MTSSKPC